MTNSNDLDTIRRRHDRQPKAERILIVEDEKPIRMAVQEILRLEGFHCDSAEDVQQALQLLRTAEYHLILSDIRMPGLDGWFLLRHVTEQYPDTAVIMITGVSDVDSAVEALSSGAYDYVTKPFAAHELTSKIANALERRLLILGNRQYKLYLEERVQEQTAHLQRALKTIEAAYHNTLEALINALDAREQEVQRHSKRVAEYALLMAREMAIDSEQLLELERGALLHDIGKIGISDNILLKPGKLTDEEWQEIRRHPQIGHSILKNVDFLGAAAQIVLQHHERFDGTGYPLGLSGNQIVLGARIFAVVDAFDAMTSDRPYRKALDYQFAREEIVRFSGRQFDPELVQCFLGISEQTWADTKASLISAATSNALSAQQ